MSREQHEKLTQNFSTFGDKLLQHTDVLYEMQVHRKIKPITIQLAPCEVCNSFCPFCSVGERPLASFLQFDRIVKLLQDFKVLGAKSVEITGGGNPLLYKDKIAGKDINDIVVVARNMGYDVGIITNSCSLKRLKSEVFDLINWVRVSLIMLDEGKQPEDYDFNGFPYEKLGFSYIIYEGANGSSAGSKRIYEGTSEKTIEKIAHLVDLHDGNIKFVRFAGNCLIKGNNALVRKNFEDVIEANDKYKKFFIKTIDSNDGAYDDGCYVGLIRPYVAPHPTGNGEYFVYACTSHVLNTRTYDLDYSLCSIDDIIPAWERMNENYKTKGYPYEIKGNGGCGWSETCKFCYYSPNNKLLHTVASEMSDKNFP